MPLRIIARPPVRLRTFVVCIVTCVAAACVEPAQRAGATEAAVQPEGGNVSQTSQRAEAVRAPVDTVDSLTAASRATVLDTSPIRRAAASVRASADTAAPGDTARRRARPAVLGPRSGDRHPAFRDAGSPLDSLWPVKGPAPLPGSILPAKRIIAYYGNPLSRGMGILGATEPDDMLRKLDAEVAAWNRIDPATPVQPALHLIVLVANGHPGANGLYRTRHDSAMVERVYGWARSRNALLFLDLQVGRSTLQYELPWIEKFLVRPDVHLGIDPEFSMKRGGVPGQRVGTYDAADINYASRFLANLVEKHGLPPKILVVHRFTPGGVTNTRKITLDPRVQIVMHMDGFGAPWVKRDTYWRDIKREPVQFTGWKQFTRLRNDRPPTPRGEILRLWPVPVYIQIQ
jgi:hypothetical protein